MGICCSGFSVLSIALVVSGDSRSHSWLQVIQVISRVKEEEKKKKHTKGSRRNAAAAASAVAAATAAVAVADVVAAACFWGGGGRDRAAAVAASHQEILEIHIRHYEPPKCIVDGRLRYELVIIL